MPRRSLTLACATLLVVAAVAVVLLRGGGERPRAAVEDPLAEALGYAPASSEIVGSLDVQPSAEQGRALRDLARTFPAARFGAEGVRSAITGLGFDPDADLPALLGGPLVIAGPSAALGPLGRSAAGLRLDLAPVLSAGALAAVVGRSGDDVRAVFARAVADGRLRRLGELAPGTAEYALPDGAGRVGVRGADVVLAGTSARLADAFALRDRGGGLTRAAFEQRLGPLAGPALVRLAAQPRVLLSTRARGVPFVDALRGGALALRIERAGLSLRAHLATDPARLRPEDLPLAPGAAPPSPAPGREALSGGVRGLGQTIRVLDAARHDLRLPFLGSVLAALDTLDAVRGPLKTFGRIDVDAALIDQLTGTTTFTREPGGVGIRAELRDGAPLRAALRRIAAIPDVAISLTRITDLDLDRAGAEAYEVRRNGTTFLRLAVLGNTLVASTDLNAGLRAIADRRPQRVDRPGALAFHARGIAIQDLLVRRLGLPDLARLFLGGFGDLDGSARAERSGVDLEATLGLER